MNAEQKQVLDAVLTIINGMQNSLGMDYSCALHNGKLDVAAIYAHQNAAVAEVRHRIVASLTLEDPAEATE